MTAGPFQQYQKGVLKLAKQQINFETDTMKALLLVNGHTVDLANHEFVADVVANEHAATGGYSRKTIATPSIGIVSGKVRFDCAKIDFGDNVSIAARYCAIYKEITNDADSPLLAIIDANADGAANVVSTNSDWDINVNASGIFEITPNV